MNRYKCVISYHGENYGGWQKQPNANTVQVEIEKALSTVFQKKISLLGASRTDARVHAKGQVAHFDIDEELNIYRIKHSLNCLLPKEIRILSMEKVSLDFHARYSAKKKRYIYRIYTHDVADPLLDHLSYHHPSLLDLNLLEQALQKYVGKHDFTGFACEANKGCAARNGVRTIFEITASPHSHGVDLTFIGDGFLYKMVRNLVGVAVSIASHKKPLSLIDEIFKTKDIRLAPLTAPAKGLCLEEIYY